ncbi:hypothetical protein QA641_05155 [Bradyrhizobium sp. CB1650]|uniref:hypothetical protein n=1 Tax=Bradyrhizobium sp. CB1650 TaxID=3039153 RepID=UPI002435E6E8|nr:hypothetical protein [Bradyrhizobium sp. CB1650]WGD53311.1 hypothetical protein QA641_05155 [Bradyrhizobium sp. CB1650]
MATAASPREQHTARDASTVDEIEMEGGETDVGEFFLTERRHMAGREVRPVLNVAVWHRRRRCASRERKSQTGYAQRRHRGFGHPLLFRSLLRSLHGRILQGWKNDVREYDPMPSEQGGQDLRKHKLMGLGWIAFIFLNEIAQFNRSHRGSARERSCDGCV